MHDLNLAGRFADQMIVLDRGRVRVADRPATVLTTRLLAEVFEVDADVTSVARALSVVVPIRAAPPARRP